MKGDIIHKLQLYYKDEYIRLFQGDCLEVMDKLIEKGIKFDLIFTDLPFGTTACKWDIIIPFDKMWERVLQLSNKNTAIIFNATQPFTTDLINSNRELFKYCSVWIKDKPSNFANANKMPMRYHEDIVVFYNNLPTYNKTFEEREGTGKNRVNYTITNGFEDNDINEHKFGCKAQSKKYSDYKQIGTVIKAKVELRKTGEHPTKKPISLCEHIINTYTNENDLILDFTCGSGTTLLASRNLKRKCIGIELEEKYCEIAKQRLEEF